MNKVASDYASFLSQRIVPWARKNGSRVYVAGVLPPVVNDACQAVSVSLPSETLN